MKVDFKYPFTLGWTYSASNCYFQFSNISSSPVIPAGRLVDGSYFIPGYCINYKAFDEVGLISTTDGLIFHEN